MTTERSPALAETAPDPAIGGSAAASTPLRSAPDPEPEAGPERALQQAVIRQQAGLLARQECALAHQACLLAHQERVLAATGTGLWSCRLADGALEWSGGVHDLFGIPRGQRAAPGADPGLRRAGLAAPAGDDPPASDHRARELPARCRDPHRRGPAALDPDPRVGRDQRRSGRPSLRDQAGRHGGDRPAVRAEPARRPRPPYRTGEPPRLRGAVRRRDGRLRPGSPRRPDPHRPRRVQAGQRRLRPRGR